MNKPNDSKIGKRKQKIVNNQSNANYDVGTEIIYKTEVKKSNLCDFNEAYILIMGNITFIGHQGIQMALKNYRWCWRFRFSHTMYSQIEYSSNYCEPMGCLWFYSKDEGTSFDSDIANNNDFECFDCKDKSLRNTEVDQGNWVLKNTTIAVPLKYPSNFWRLLKMLLINCKVELKLNWTKYCVLSEAGANNNNANSDSIIFTIKDTKLYAPVVNKRQSKTIKSF